MCVSNVAVGVVVIGYPSRIGVMHDCVTAQRYNVVCVCVCMTIMLTTTVSSFPLVMSLCSPVSLSVVGGISVGHDGNNGGVTVGVAISLRVLVVMTDVILCMVLVDGCFRFGMYDGDDSVVDVTYGVIDDVVVVGDVVVVNNVVRGL